MGGRGSPADRPGDGGGIARRGAQAEGEGVREGALDVHTACKTLAYYIQIYSIHTIFCCCEV